MSTAVDNEPRFAETHIKIAFGRSTDLLQLITYQPSNYCLFSCVAARCAYLVAKLPLIISSCRLRRRSLTVRSWNRDVSSDAWHHINPSLFPKPIRGSNFRILLLFFFGHVFDSRTFWRSLMQAGLRHASRPIQPLNDLERRKMAMDWTTAYRRRRCSSPRPVTATQHNLYCHGGTRSACVYWVNSTQRSAPNRTTLLIYRTPSGLEWSYYGRTSECAGLYLASRWFCVGGFICCRSISALA